MFVVGVLFSKKTKANKRTTTNTTTTQTSKQALTHKKTITKRNNCLYKHKWHAKASMLCDVVGVLLLTKNDNHEQRIQHTHAQQAITNTSNKQQQTTNHTHEKKQMPFTQQLSYEKITLFYLIVGVPV